MFYNELKLKVITNLYTLIHFADNCSITDNRLQITIQLMFACLL